MECARHCTRSTEVRLQFARSQVYILDRLIIYKGSNVCRSCYRVVVLYTLDIGMTNISPCARSRLAGKCLVFAGKQVLDIEIPCVDLCICIYIIQCDYISLAMSVGDVIGRYFIHYLILPILNSRQHSDMA